MTALKPIFDKYHLTEKKNYKEEGQDCTENKFDSLEVINLQKKYQDREVFAHPINLCILKNQKVGIYGKSSSGKTTFMKIISGQIRSYTGEIQLNKVELNRLKYSALQKILLYVEQTPYLFNDTVRYNLTLGEDFTDNEIIDALKKANLWKTISNLPDGLNTEINENGNNFSGGQKQRLALARGLLRKRKLFLLDESTSNLDKKTALKVENTF